jgi:hypothetical protein
LALSTQFALLDRDFPVASLIGFVMTLRLRNHGAVDTVMRLPHLANVWYRQTAKRQGTDRSQQLHKSMEDGRRDLVFPSELQPIRIDSLRVAHQ